MLLGFEHGYPFSFLTVVTPVSHRACAHIHTRRLNIQTQRHRHTYKVIDGFSLELAHRETTTK